MERREFLKSCYIMDEGLRKLFVGFMNFVIERGLKKPQFLSPVSDITRAY